MGMKICDGCRIKLTKVLKNSASPEAGPSSANESPNFKADSDASLDALNQSLELLGESPIKRKRLTSQKLEKVKVVIEKRLSEDLRKRDNPSSKNVGDKHDCEIIKQLKEKFAHTSKRSEKMLLLSCLPLSWTRSKIEQEFGVSQYMARAVKKMVKEKGILSTPNPKPGKTVSSDTVTLVTEFYMRDDISRMMPGKKDCVVIKKEGSKEYAQKKLLLANLKEIYAQFKSEYPHVKIGFTKFYELKPRNCIFAGKSGTHTVCVCTVHQNVKLMITGSKINQFIVNENHKPVFPDYHACLSKIICNPPNVDCFFDSCPTCPRIEGLKQNLMEKFDEFFIDSVTYKKWVSVDRCNMETIIKPIDEFLDEFTQDLLKLKTHSFISNMQKEFYNETKTNLKFGEALITCDFAENYSFVLQDEVQSYHWTTSQATLHPFVIYYRNEEGELKHLNYVFISDCLIHNTIAFHLFLQQLIAELKEKIINLSKIYYFSDGCAAQYKNKKNFINLCYHQEEFGVKAEWHFFATSHGKSACDGLGGTVKRLATKASLQRPYQDQIMTPEQLFQFAQENIAGITFRFCTTADYETHAMYLEKRFAETLTIPGTQKVHSVIPVSKSKIMTKSFSLSLEQKTQELLRCSEITNSELMSLQSGFVTVEYDKLWWLACIIGHNEESDELKISFLHPNGPASSFYYPTPRADILVVERNAVLKRVQPLTSTGRTYTLTKDEMLGSSKILEKRN
ncbi:unnamed protein product [Brassicogethes aeneus]|uniref:Cc8L18.2-like protein n=1 Tax=Brassicogethes aeneus TaxID=1431903 RepID=A0A9P0ARF2_BRAAE|nr:unnamed protein product [Brassicogethes aeneus]